MGTDTLTRECYIQVDAIPGINVTATLTGINIFPNPSDGTFRITLQAGSEGSADCHIFNVYGREAYHCQLSQIENVIRTSLPKGIYTVSILLEDQTLTSKLIVR